MYDERSSERVGLGTIGSEGPYPNDPNGILIAGNYERNYGFTWRVW